MLLELRHRCVRVRGQLLKGDPGGPAELLAAIQSAAEVLLVLGGAAQSKLLLHCGNRTEQELSERSVTEAEKDFDTVVGVLWLTETELVVSSNVLVRDGRGGGVES